MSITKQIITHIPLATSCAWCWTYLFSTFTSAHFHTWLLAQVCEKVKESTGFILFLQLKSLEALTLHENCGPLEQSMSMWLEANLSSDTKMAENSFMDHKYAVHGWLQLPLSNHLRFWTLIYGMVNSNMHCQFYTACWIEASKERSPHLQKSKLNWSQIH